ncbi:MAG: HD domain-containing phosphohydrolase [Halanaerobiaceae bacterium]
MIEKEYCELLVTGIEAAGILSVSEEKPSILYEKVAEILYSEFDNHEIADQMRLYVIKQGEEVLEEEIFYNASEGLQPGYDSIPFYQLPDELLSEEEIAVIQDDNQKFILVPFFYEAELIGMMELRTPKKNRVSEELLDELSDMAAVLSIGLSQMLYIKSNMLYQSFFNTALEINKQVQSLNALEGLVSSFMKLTASRLKFDRVTVFIFAEDGDIIISRCYQSRGNEFSLDVVPELPELNEGPEALEYASGYWFPLRTHSRDVGRILFDNIYSLYRIPERLVEVLQILCSQFAAAVDNLRLFANLQRSAHYDELTGLYNRSYLDKEMDNLADSRNLPMSIILGDVNGLKITNDVFGHLEGDNILIKISSILENVCRDDDVIARWGGDEFIIFLPNTIEKNVENICARINEACSLSSNSPIGLSIALGHATRKNSEEEICSVIKKAEDQMYRNKLMETKNFRRSLISSLLDNVLKNSQETPEHADRLVRISDLIAREMNLSSRDTNNLKLLAMVHDIGMVALDSAILNKPGNLTEDEWRQVVKHPELGYRIARASFELSPIAEYILSHHEWWDGTGYPLGKKGNQIPLLARIFSVVDAYEVMTDGRNYREPISGEKALFELNRCAGSQFDPELVEVFTDVIKDTEYFTEEKTMTVSLKDSLHASLMKYVLEKKDINFTIKSFSDEVYQGVYFTPENWGYLESEEEYREEVNEVNREVMEKMRE